MVDPRSSRRREWARPLAETGSSFIELCLCFHSSIFVVAADPVSGSHGSCQQAVDGGSRANGCVCCFWILGLLAIRQLED